MAQVMETLQPWLAALDQRPRGGARWLQDLRDRAASRFVELGFPTVRDEEWRFTSVAAIASSEFLPAAPVRAGAEVLGGTLYADAPTGSCSPTDDSRPGCRERRSQPVSASVPWRRPCQHADVVGRYLGQLAVPADRAFAALNTAFVQDGAYLYVPDGLVIEQPLQILFVSTPGTAPAMTHPRVLIVAGDRTEVRIVESYASASDQKHFSNAVTEIVAGEGAVVDHYKIAEEGANTFHIASMHVHASRNSNVSTHAFTLGGRLVRNDILAVLDGEGAECTLNGLYFADGERHVDTHTTIDHAKPHCPSPEISRVSRARRVQRQDHRAPGRAEDRREADESCAAAVRRRFDQHQAAARDLRG